MRRLCLIWMTVAASCLLAQDEAELTRLREMVDAGVMPRRALDEALAAQEQVKDDEILQSTLYGRLTLEQLTPDQTAAMLGAAQRQLDRAQRRVDETKRLIAEGVRPFTSLTPFLEELDRVRKAHDAAAGRARLFENLAAMARAEQELENQMDEELSGVGPPAGRYEGAGMLLQPAQHRYLETAYLREFGRTLPVSAEGETELHRSLGFDHRGRMDVGVHPDSREGVWLRDKLELLKVPYIAFRAAVRGSSTGAHIHVGPPSVRFRRGD